MPHILDVVAAEHRAVEDLFTQFEETGDEQLALQICDELMMHTSLEEELVYPELIDIDEEAMREAVREHGEAQQLIETARTASDTELADVMDALRDAVDHHVAEEESEIFGKLEELGEHRLETLGALWEERRRAVTA